MDRVGEIALAVLREKARRTGIELRPSQFKADIVKRAQRMGAPVEIVNDVYRKFLVPAATSGCGVTNSRIFSGPPEVPTPQELSVAHALLSEYHFASTLNLRKELLGLSEACSIPLQEMVSVAVNILRRRLEKELYRIGDFDPLEQVVVVSVPESVNK